MTDTRRINQFKMAYHNEGTPSGAFVMSNGSIGQSVGHHTASELAKFSIHKRAVSSKKNRAGPNKKKMKSSAVQMLKS